MQIDVGLLIRAIIEICDGATPLEWDLTKVPEIG